MKKYKVKLNPEERLKLESIVNNGKRSVYERRHAQILLLCNEGKVGS